MDSAVVVTGGVVVSGITVVSSNKVVGVVVTAVDVGTSQFSAFRMYRTAQLPSQ